MAWSKDNSRLAIVAAEEALAQAERAELAANSVDTVITESEKVTNENKTRFLNAVSTVVLRDSTYPTPVHGDTVRVTGTSTSYRFVTGAGWVITDIYNPTAIDQVSAQLVQAAYKQMFPQDVVVKLEGKTVGNLTLTRNLVELGNITLA
jgi:hypothetical protein